MPRSGCRTSNVSSTTVTGTTGESAYFQRCMTARRATRTWAPHSVSATFTASDGCTENAPNVNQARDPLRVSPTNSTATSASAPTTSAAGASDRSLRGEIRSPRKNISRPGTQNISWRVNTEYEEPSAVSASTEDADSTMTSPNSVSRPNTPSTRCSEVSGRRSHWPSAAAVRPTARRSPCGRAVILLATAPLVPLDDAPLDAPLDVAPLDVAARDAVRTERFRSTPGIRSPARGHGTVTTPPT